MNYLKATISFSLILIQTLAIIFGSRAQTLPSYHIYAGNTHAHTAYTSSHGSQLVKAGMMTDSQNVSHPKDATLKPNWQKLQGFPAEHFAIAKANGYDFYITTDHSQEEAFYPTSANSLAWKASIKAAKDATDSNFVALTGFEYSENNSPNGKGHINVINSSAYINALEPQIDLPYLYKWLATVAPNGEGPVVASFNHPGPGQYANFGYRDEKVTNIITMLEVINSNKNVHYEGFIRALDAGWKVSPVSGNDNHGLGGITSQKSRTFVLATQRTKAAILDAMKNRRTYASFDQDIVCRYTVNNKIMGSTLSGGAKVFHFDINISEPDTSDPKGMITKIDIVKDSGTVVESYSPSPAFSLRWTPTIKDSSSKYFFVRVWNGRVNGAPAGGASNETEEAGGNVKPAKAANTEKIPGPVAWLAPVWTGR
ncbi:MAG: hypothetical protein ABI151_05370 [Chitinophagaceae bacterium]